MRHDRLLQRDRQFRSAPEFLVATPSQRTCADYARGPAITLKAVSHPLKSCRKAVRPVGRQRSSGHRQTVVWLGFPGLAQVHELPTGGVRVTVDDGVQAPVRDAQLASESPTGAVESDEPGRHLPGTVE